MVTKRTGRPRERPERNFFKDPNRYVLAPIEAIMDGGVKFEPAALLVLSVAESNLIPLEKALKTKLSRSNEWRLTRGWKLLSFKRIKQTPKISSQIDTLRLKRKHYAKDAAAQLWLHNMRNAWINLLWYDRIGPVAELLIFKCCEAAGESRYAKERMLPILRSVTA
jgi:hypothetical protein